MQNLRIADWTRFVIHVSMLVYCQRTKYICTVQSFLSRGCLKRCYSNLKLIIAQGSSPRKFVTYQTIYIFLLIFLNFLFVAVSLSPYFSYLPLSMISKIYGGRSGTGASPPSPRHWILFVPISVSFYPSVILPLLHTHISLTTNAV